MLSLKELVTKISYECEEECYIDHQLEDDGLLLIRLRSDEGSVFEQASVMLSIKPEGHLVFELDALKTALDLPFESTPRFLVEMALSGTVIQNDL